MDRFDDAFFREAKSQIRELNDGLLAVENDDGDVAVDELFRVAHSLKGTCRIQGLSEAGDLAHALEDALGAIRSGDVEPTTALIDDALAVVDVLEAVVRADANDDELDRDVDAPRESLRTALNVARMETPSADAAADGPPLEGMLEDEGDADSEGDADDEWDPADDGLSDDVVAALEETTEFDDVDALFDETGGGEPGDELDGWGLLDEDATADDEETAGAANSAATSDGAETPDNPSAFFERTKTELDDEGAIDSLQEEIDAVEFGEFDDDDNYTIDQLMDLEPDEPAPEDKGSTSGDDEAATEFGDRSAADPATTDSPPRTASTEAVRGDEVDEPTDSEVETEPDGATPTASVEPDAAEDAVNEFVFGDPQEDGSAPDGAEPDDEPSATDESEPESKPDGEPATMGQNDGEPAASSTPADVPDPDSVPDTDLGIDLSDDLGVGSDDDWATDDDWTADSEMDVSVDEEMAEFESRFDDLLGNRPGEGTGRDGPTLRSAVGTIEESRLDADEFPTAEGIDELEGPGEFDRLQEMTVGVETADQLLNVAEELSLTHLRLDEAVGPDTDEAITEEVSNLLRVVTEYRRTVMDVRLMPLRTAVEGIPRTVRDIARSQDKDVELVVEDADVELDRGIIDELRDPLVHVARNAVDHGIEPPDDRVAAGKEPEGTVEIRAERVDDEVVIEVSDDGRGIEPEALRQRAVDKGVLTRKEARRLGDDATYDLLFEPGFTTRDEVTDVSGRGVGMDVVSRTVADLNGTVTVDSEPGAGTTVRLTVPVSIVFTEVLFVEANRETFGIPMSVVEQITATPPIRADGDRDVVRRSDLDSVGELSVSDAGTDGAGADDAVASDADDAGADDAEAEDAYPLLRLQSALDMDPGTGADDEGQLVWVRAESERLAIRCDRVVTSREVVVRPYGDLLRDVPGVSGATTLGDGEAVNVLDVGSI